MVVSGAETLYHKGVMMPLQASVTGLNFTRSKYSGIPKKVLNAFIHYSAIETCPIFSEMWEI